MNKLVKIYQKHTFIVLPNVNYTDHELFPTENIYKLVNFVESWGVNW